jgi:tape measure domain-containing protein
MSTLDKLKQKLHLPGATKGLEDVSTAAKKVDLSNIGNSAETVGLKFNAMFTVADQALRNITNSAMNAAKRIVSAFTIDPVKTGFQEYELKMGSIQTIMASTGASLETVNGYLNELNEYSDKTIYSFSDMTQNIGKFTNAGVKLEDAVMAIKGISNEAAVSGANANEASRAMYNFAQALSAGYVKLIDWKSIENANMATVEFKNELIKTAVELGVVTKASDGMYKTLSGNTFNATKNFNEVLNDQWMTTDVLIKTLGRYADETTDLGKKAYSSAQDVKTFSMMMDTLKESAQSGWAQTWELIVGDFEEAKSFWTYLTGVFSKMIEASAEIRNKILGGALNSKWDQLTEKIEAAGISTETFNEKLKETIEESGQSVDELIKKHGSLAKAFSSGEVSTELITETLKKLIGVEEDATEVTEELGEVVDDVIRGKYGNGEDRVKALTKAGYKYSKVQNLVNEKLGSSVRILDELSEEEKKNITTLASLSEETLKSKGYTEEQIKALKELKEAAENGGTSINELIGALEKPSGRELLIESVKNILEGIEIVIGRIKLAWKNVFKSDASDASDGIYTMLEGLAELSKSFVISDATADNFQKVVEGLLSLWDLGYLFISGSLTSGLKLLKAVLGLFGTDLMTVAGQVGELITKFHDWVKENTMLMGGIDKIALILKTVIEGIYNVINAFLDLEIVQDGIAKLWERLTEIFGKFSLEFNGFSAQGIADTIKSAFDNIIEWINGLDSSEVAKNFIDGLVNGLGDGIAWVVDTVVSLGKALLQAICDVLGIHSPSKETYEIGKNFVQGFIDGVTEFASKAWEILKEFGSKCLEIVSKIDWGKILAAGMVISMLSMFKKTVELVERLTAPLTTLSDMFKSFGRMADTIGSTIRGVGQSIEGAINARKLETKSKAILNFAIAIGILAASVWVLSEIPVKDLLKAGAAILVLSGILAGLLLIASKMGKFGDVSIKAGVILSIAASLVLVAFALKKLASIELSQVPSVLATFTIAIAGLVGVVAAIGKFTKGRNKTNIISMSWLLIKLAAALLIMTFVIKLAAGLDGSDLTRGMIAIGLVGGLFAGVIALSKIAGAHASKAGSMLLKMSIAMGIMVGVIKIASMLDYDEVNKALKIMGLVGILFTAFIAVSKFAGEHSSRAGSMIMKLGISLSSIAMAMKLIGKLTPEEIEKGIDVISKMGLLFAGLIAISKLSGQHAVKAGGMLIMISGALLIVSAAMFVISKLIDPEDLVRVTAAISMIGIMFMGLIAASKLATDCEKMLTKMVIAISILSVAIIALSFIPAEDLRNATIALSSVIGVFAALVGITRFAKATKGMNKTLISMIVVVGLLAGIVAGLSYIDGDRAIVSTAALATLMLSFATSMAILHKAGTISKSVSKQLLPMLGVVAALSLIVAGLSLINPGSVIVSTTAVAILMEAFAVALVIMSKAGRISTTVSKQLYPMLLVVTGLGAILSAMSFLPNPDALIPSAVALSILLNALAVAMVILSNARRMTATAMVPAALMGLVLGEIALVLGLLTNKVKNVDSLIPIAASLSILLIALSSACAILSVVGATGPAAIIGAGILAAVVAILGVLAIAIGEIMERIPQSKIDEWKSGIDKFMQLLTELASGLGEAIGAFIGGIAMGTLEGIGTGLTNFMNNAQGFIDGAKKVDTSVLEGVGILAASIIALTAADFISGVDSFMPLSSGFAQLGNELTDFMRNAQGFIFGATKITPEVATGIKALAETILILTAADLLEGITKLFGMETSLSDFGNELRSFGPSIAEYAKSVSGIDCEAVKASASAAKTLAEMAQTLPNEGGLLGKIFGENSMDTFGVQLESFGKSLKAYGVAVTGIAVEPINVSVEAARSLASMAESIPNMGGLVSFFTGDNDLVTFGLQLQSFGYSLKAYGLAVTGLVLEPINLSVQAAKSLAGMAESIPNMGGLLSFFTGDNDLVTFGTQLVSFGGSLKAYSAAVLGLAVEPIAQSVEAARSLSQLAAALPSDGGFWSWFKDDTVSLAEFGLELIPFGKYMRAYSDAVSGINLVAMLSAVTGAKHVANLIRGLVGIDTSGVGPFATALKTLGQTSVDKFISAFTDAKAKLVTIGSDLINSIISGITSAQMSLINTVNLTLTSMLNAINSAQLMFQMSGMLLMVAFGNGITVNTSSVLASIVSMLTIAVVGVRGYYSSFHAAGGYLVDGLAAGISANKSKAIAAAAAVAAAALAAANAVLGIQSPSKEFYETGSYAGMGFVNALGDYGDKSYDAGANMANSAKSGLSKAISKIRDAIDSDMDMQPTIRPVLDLSGIQNGARGINGMFASQSMRLATANAGVSGINLNAIVSGMNGRNEMSNSDVVAAISELRSDFGSLAKAVGNMQIRMDSGVVVGELIGKIDTGLGQISTHRGRGN